MFSTNSTSYRGLISLLAVAGFLSACGKAMDSDVVNQSRDPLALTEEFPSTTITTKPDSATAEPEASTTTVKYSSTTTTTVEPETTVMTAPGSADFDPSLLMPGSRKEDFANEGDIQPTVFYNAIINDDAACQDADRVVLYGVGGVELNKVCPATLSTCGLQGSCTLILKGQQIFYNVISQVKGVDRFAEVDEDECPFGLGVRSICLDPFYTVAADLRFYKPGDVIFIPAAVGLELIAGKKHTGFFIVRDQGRDILGKGRFDFFSGFYSWRDPKNPFRPIKLADPNTRMTYYRVTGETAKQVLQSRSFPGLPSIKKAK